MTSAYARARYGVWNHASQLMAGALEWRETPKSKKFVGVIPAVTLPGTVTVQRAGAKYIDVELDDRQAELIEKWLSNLPSHVLPSTAQTDLLIQHTGVYTCLTNRYEISRRVPRSSETVQVRVSAEVTAVGPLRKASIIISDVLFA